MYIAKIITDLFNGVKLSYWSSLTRQRLFKMFAIYHDTSSKAISIYLLFQRRKIRSIQTPGLIDTLTLLFNLGT
jgi:hypothetical protein